MEGSLGNIDLREVIASKNPALARRIPDFILRILARYLHLNEINEFLSSCCVQESGVELCGRWLDFLGVRANIRFVNREALFAERRLIFVSNHPLGGIDGVFLIHILGRLYPSVKFVVNDFLTFIPPLEPMFVPVNKMGAMKRGYSQQFARAFESPAHIICFPAGLCSRLMRGAVKDLPWHNSFVKQAVKYNRDIVPIYFGGRNSMLFYVVAWLRKLFGIKFNVEMTMLPHEMFRKKSATFDIVIGAPVSIDSIRDETRNFSRNGEGGAAGDELRMHKRALDGVCSHIREISYSLKEFSE